MSESSPGLIELSKNPNNEVSGVVTTDKVNLANMSRDRLEAWLYDSKNYHNGSHFLSSADNRKYQDLCATRLDDAVIFLREKWNEYADHNFIQSFLLVHWVGNEGHGLDRISRLLGDSRHQVEISTQAYRDSESLMHNKRWLKSKFGVLISGQVTLASNADIQTNQWSMLQPSDSIIHRKYTDLASRLMTDETNCVSPYEFVVGDWVASGIIVDSDSEQRGEIDLLAKQYGLPVVGTQDENLFKK